MLIRRKGFHSGAIKAVFRANGREGEEGLTRGRFPLFLRLN